MSYKIEEFINEITKNVLGDITFQGDGSGDFEESSEHTTKECLMNYIKHCESQIDIAKQCLKDMIKKEIEDKVNHYEYLTKKIIEIYGWDNLDVYKEIIHCIIYDTWSIRCEVQIWGNSFINSYVEKLKDKYRKELLAII